MAKQIIREADKYLHENARGYWEIRWTAFFDDGTSSTQKTSTRTKDRRYAAEMLEDFKATDAQLSAPKTLTVDAAFDLYLHDHIKLHGKNGGQAQNLVSFRRLHGDMDVLDLSKDTIRSYTRTRRGEGVKDGTIRRELGAVRAALSWVRDETDGHLPEGWNLKIKLPEDSPAREIFLSEEEEPIVWGHAVARATSRLSLPRRRTALAVCIAMQTAARAEAIRGLTWDRVDFEARRIDFRDPGRRTTRKRRIMVPMSDRIRAVLWDEYQRRNPANPFVLGHDGSIIKQFTAWIDKIGFGHINFHDFRRTWATHRAMWGVPMEDIAAVLGDTLATTEKHYAHFHPDYLRAAVNQHGPVGGRSRQRATGSAAQAQHHP